MTQDQKHPPGPRPELSALAGRIKIWLPGLKGDPMVIAGTIERQLLKRGVRLSPQPDTLCLAAEEALD